MIRKRPAAERGHANHGWLDTRFSFSFADYYDPEHMGFRTLRVINDDTIQPGRGFGTHPHRDMEIVTYVLDGALEHRDNMGTGSVLRPGDVQRMSAGTGVLHSEFNHSKEETLRLLQIWILPAVEGIAPGYEEKHFDEAARTNRLRLIVSPQGDDGSLRIHQDARVYASILEPGSTVHHEIEAKRHAWLQVARGSVSLNGVELVQGDGAAVSGEEELSIEGVTPAEFLLFDLN